MAWASHHPGEARMQFDLITAEEPGARLRLKPETIIL